MDSAIHSEKINSDYYNALNAYNRSKTNVAVIECHDFEKVQDFRKYVTPLHIESLNDQGMTLSCDKPESYHIGMRVKKSENESFGKGCNKNSKMKLAPCPEGMYLVYDQYSLESDGILRPTTQGSAPTIRVTAVCVSRENSTQITVPKADCVK